MQTTPTGLLQTNRKEVKDCCKTDSSQMHLPPVQRNPNLTVTTSTHRRAE